MKRILVAIGSAGLVLAASASAKEIQGVRVCGASGCGSVAKSAIAAFGHGPWMSEQPQGSSGAAPQPYYLVKILIGERGRPAAGAIAGYFAPGAALLRQRVEAGRPAEPWVRPSAKQLAAIRAAAKGLRPYAAPRLVSVSIDGRRVVATERYLALLAASEARPIPANAGPTTTIYLHWRGQNPWSSESSLAYMARVNLVCRSDGCFRVPDAVAADVERGLASARR